MVNPNPDSLQAARTLGLRENLRWFSSLAWISWAVLGDWIVIFVLYALAKWSDRWAPFEQDVTLWLTDLSLRFPIKQPST